MEPTLARADLGDVGCPEDVGTGWVEVAANQIGRGHDGVRACGAPPSSSVCADLMLQAHQPCHAFAAAAPPGSGQFGVYPRCAVSAMRTFVDRRDRVAQLRVDGLPRRGWPGEEGIEPRAGDREDSTEPLDAIGVSMIGDESEAADRIVSWAK
jgi:hypothetical protein